MYTQVLEMEKSMSWNAISKSFSIFCQSIFLDKPKPDIGNVFSEIVTYFNNSTNLNDIFHDFQNWNNIYHNFIY